MCGKACSIQWPLQPASCGFVHCASMVQDISWGPTVSTLGQPRVGIQPLLGMEGREKQQVPPGRPIVDSNPLWWPALRSAGPHAVSLITLQEDICHWTSFFVLRESWEWATEQRHVFAEHAVNLGLVPWEERVEHTGAWEAWGWGSEWTKSPP